MAGDALLSESDLRGTGDAPLVVALSGGLDSCVLLHALAALPAVRERGLRAVHVHHGLHADADAWTHHCQVLCDELQVALRIVRVDVDRGGNEGLEAAARRVRHAALEAELGDGDVIAMAHHRDDQSETFLLRALRASGPEGLRAMSAWRRFGRGWLWRPLLDRPRAELLAHAREAGLRWIDDPSNADTAFDRNFLRQRVLPLLRERWPQADAAFARSAALCNEAAGLLEDEDVRALASVRTLDSHALRRAPLRALAPARRARVLRRWIADLTLPPLSGEGVARIDAELLHARDDAQARFAWSGAVVHAWRDVLHAESVRAPLPLDWHREWDGASPLGLPDGSRIDLTGASTSARFDRPLAVHARHGGERIVLPGRTHSHALKHVLQDLGVPPWVRARLPLLTNGDGELLAAGDLVYSAAFDTWLRERGLRLHWA